ncbi:MAG: AAA family ATPase, partial [Saprospiraceae bacterium]|nr:AAA family ATPase [Saprospiraceae bacterium]
MEKRFNITGVCRPKEHYMADVSKKLAQTLKYVERGEYFIINRPRQYGKTTTLFSIARMLRETGNYIVFSISFEGVGDSIFETEERFSKGFLSILETRAKYQNPDWVERLHAAEERVNSLENLSDEISTLLQETDKPVVLLVDEVDKSTNNQLFVSFLAMLRDKYLVRDEAKTFHSIVLACVHDVKTMKLKLRPDEERKYNSPWNIAADFTVDMNLQPFEIKPMLDEYAAD